MGSTSHIVECTGLSKQFVAGGKAFVALHEVNFVVPRAQFVAVTGPSGSGKSTLLNLIGGLDRPTNGSVRVAGREIGAMAEPELARLRNLHIGFVFQQFQLLARYDVTRNVELPLKYAGVPKAKRAQRARELLVRLGLEEHVDKRPSELSGGQQQRVAIARALANKPALILADEPTGALDSGTGMDVVGLLRALCREDGLTVVMVTHDSDLAAESDRIVRFADGRLIVDKPVSRYAERTRALALVPRTLD